MLLNSYIFSVKSDTNIFCPIYLDARDLSPEIKELKEKSTILEFVAAIKKGCSNLIKEINISANKLSNEDFLTAKNLSGATVLHMVENGNSK